MKKQTLKCSSLALFRFVIAFLTLIGAESAFAQMAPVFGTYNNPSIIFQNQAAMNIYGMNGLALGQLTPGAIFQAQMARDPFEYILNQPSFNYPGFLQTAVQMQTPYGQMIPASLQETAMLANGTTLLPDTSFYIPPAEFSYENIRAIGAQSDSEDELINNFMDKVINGPVETEDEDTIDEDGYHHQTRSGHELTVQRPAGQYFTNASLSQNSQSISRPHPIDTADVQDDGPFRILGPTCDCRSRGMSCVVTGGFGVHRAATRKSKAHNHAGVDIAGGYGTPLIAAADGYVTVAYRSSSYGNTIDIKHADNYMTRYAHMSKFIVQPGEYVKKGQIIGYMGNTGHVESKSKGPTAGTHLHFELCKLRTGEKRCFDGNVINPLRFMSSNGSINQNSQLNMTCSDAASRGSSNADSSSSRSSTSARSAKAVR